MKRLYFFGFGIGGLVFLLLSVFSLPASELQSVSGVVRVPTEWADGDSFRVQFPDGKEHTLRLYGVDCIEWHITDDSDARRLRSQRRYFGISNHGGSAQSSIALAKAQAERAAQEVNRLLSKPFTVHTAFADGRGDARYERIYAFVQTAEGQDLGQLLVEKGLARAYGVYRAGPGDLSRDDYQQQLKDAELVAAREGRGIWEFTDWKHLPEERLAQRQEEAEEKLAMGQAPLNKVLDINKASREELMSVPGIGEVTANRIIEARPFSSLEDLQRVQGIGKATLTKLAPYFRF